MDIAERAHRLDRQLLEARSRHRACEHTLATLLADFDRDKLYQQKGFATLADYARERLDLSVRQTRALRLLGTQMGHLPALDDAFREGRIGWTKAREILRLATPQVVEQWVAYAEDTTSRTLERAVAASSYGDPPPDEIGPPPKDPRKRLVFTVEACDAQVLRDALAWIRTTAELRGDEVDDGAALAALARRALKAAEQDEAPTGERYRTVLRHCPDCGDTTTDGAPASETIQLEASCDTEVLTVDETRKTAKLTRTIPPARRRYVLQRDGYRCVVPGCSCRLWLDVHHLRWGSRRSHDADNLVTLCSTHHRSVHQGILSVTHRPDGSVEVRRHDGRVQRSGDPRGSLALRPARSPQAGEPPSGTDACRRVTDPADPEVGGLWSRHDS